MLQRHGLVLLCLVALQCRAVDAAGPSCCPTSVCTVANCCVCDADVCRQCAAGWTDPVHGCNVSCVTNVSFAPCGNTAIACTACTVCAGDEIPLHQCNASADTVCVSTRPPDGGSTQQLAIGLGVGIGGAALLLMLSLSAFLYARMHRRKCPPAEAGGTLEPDTDRTAVRSLDPQSSQGSGDGVRDDATVADALPMQPRTASVRAGSSGSGRSRRSPRESSYYYDRPESRPSEKQLYEQLRSGSQTQRNADGASSHAEPSVDYVEPDHEPGDDYALLERCMMTKSRQQLHHAIRHELNPRSADRPMLVAALLDGVSQAPASEHVYQEILGISEDIIQPKLYPRRWLQYIDSIFVSSSSVILLASTTDGGASDSYHVAVKTLQSNVSEADVQKFLREARNLAQTRHGNVLGCIGICMPEQPWLLVVEYCRHGDLRRFLRLCSCTPGTAVTWSEACHMGAQLATGMEYLASSGLVHRDLAARNCLVAKGTIMKIADLGSLYDADSVKRGTDAAMVTDQSPVRWMAPESLEWQELTTRSNAWSFGVLLWEIATFGMLQPYRGLPKSAIAQLLRTGRRLHQPADCPAELYVLMRQCWSAEPELRPTFTQLSETLQLLSVTYLQRHKKIRDLGALVDRLASSGV